MRDNTAAMPCPIDGTSLVMSERSGIEIDYCPTCRGVWLDRGELDKIIERNAQSAPAPAQPRGSFDQQAHPRQTQPDQRGASYSGSGYPERKRKKSFLEELFD